MRKDWMFKLVGPEYFTIGKARCCITVDAAEGFMYQYLLEVNGKTLEKFSENQSKIMKTWQCNVSGMPFRIVLGIIANLLCIPDRDLMKFCCSYELFTCSFSNSSIIFLL